jgi:hypothetical protein
MISPPDTQSKVRWSRSQKFRLSEAGRSAGAALQASIVASRVEAGREAFEAACRAWAEPLALHHGDGVYLSELKDQPRTLKELLTSLDGCGPTQSDVKAALERLVNARFVELVEPPAPPPPVMPIRRW